MELLAFGSGHLLLLAALAAIAWLGGGAGARLLRLPADPPAGLRLALGFALAAQLLLGLGFAGLLRPGPVFALAALLVVAGLPAGRPGPPRAGSATGWAIAALYGLPVFVLALYPPLGFDQTLYHLPFARAFARTGALPFLGELRFPAFPPLIEVVQAAIWLETDVVATQLAGLFALLALLVLLAGWAREKAGGEAGLFAAAMVYGSPCVVYLATCGYLEPVLGLFILAAFYCAEKALTAASAGWAAAAGLFAGCAAAGKYHGLFFVAAIGAALLRREPWPANLRRLAIYGAVAALGAGPAYLRIYHLTGSPLFPFYPEIFGASPWTEESMLPRGGARWLRVLTLLWDLSFRREAVGWLPPYLPVFVAALPMAIYAAWRWPDLRRPALAILAFLLISPTHGHYFSMVAALWALIFSTGLVRLFAGTPGRRRWLLGAAALLALGGPAYAVYRMHLLGPPPTDPAGRDRLLEAQLPAYGAVVFLNREAGGATVFAAGAELARLTAYYDGILLGDVNGAESVDKVLRRAGELGGPAAAAEEIGAGWLLLGAGEKEWLALAAADPQLTQAYADAGAVVYRVRPAP